MAADEKKVRMTHEVDLGPGVVLTPGYEFAEPATPGPSMGDRRILVHMDPEARNRMFADLLRAEIPEQEIASTYAGPVAPRVAQAEAAGDAAQDARQHARTAAANKA